MSGIVGHTTYAILSLREALRRKLRTAPLATRHFSSFLAGAYLGSDIQTLPSVVCTATREEAGYGGIPYLDCPGGLSSPWMLSFEGRKYRPQRIHELYYGRSHLVFGWSKSDSSLRIAWDQLARYFAACVEDCLTFHGPSERAVAYTLGWTVHVVSDSLIKSFQPGVELKLLDGTYTPRNRPIQDLYAFHEIGIKELKLDWPSTLADIAATPVEPIQAHYMRVAPARGQLASQFAEGWAGDQNALLMAVLRENRRWARQHFHDELFEMHLGSGPNGEPTAKPSIVEKTGLSFVDMMEAARAAGLRKQIDLIASEAASMIEAVERLLSKQPVFSTIPF